MNNERKIEKKTVVAIVVGVVALGVVLFQMKGVFMPSKPPTPPPATAQAASALSGSTGQAADPGGNMAARNAYSEYIAQVDESAIAFGDKNFKNPMRAPITGDDPRKGTPSGPATKVIAVETEASAAGYSIDGIVWHEKDPLALINNQVVGLGEELEDGAVITEITRDTVRFRINGNRYYLVLREE